MPEHNDIRLAGDERVQRFRHVGRLRHRLAIKLRIVHRAIGDAAHARGVIGHARRLQGGQLRLDNVRPPVYEVFAVTNLTKLLDIRPKEAGPGTPLVASA